jgi:hypothetical protein
VALLAWVSLEGSVDISSARPVQAGPVVTRHLPRFSQLSASPALGLVPVPHLVIVPGRCRLLVLLVLVVLVVLLRQSASRRPANVDVALDVPCAAIRGTSHLAVRIWSLS